MVNGTKIPFMVQENSNGVMEMNMKVNGAKMLVMVSVYLNGIMEINMKVNTEV